MSPRKSGPKWIKDLGGGAFITSGMRMSVNTPEVLAAANKATRESVSKVVHLIRNDARILAPKAAEHVGTYKPMSQAINSGMKRTYGGLMRDAYKGSVFTTNGKAVMIEFGTGLYGPYKRIITPRKAKKMRFTWGGNMIFSKTVRGRKPTPFMVPALKKNQDKIIQILRGEWNGAKIR